jgi:hypothetical protein
MHLSNGDATGDFGYQIFYCRVGQYFFNGEKNKVAALSVTFSKIRLGPT